MPNTPPKTDAEGTAPASQVGTDSVDRPQPEQEPSIAPQDFYDDFLLKRLAPEQLKNPPITIHVGPNGSFQSWMGFLVIWEDGSATDNNTIKLPAASPSDAEKHRMWKLPGNIRVRSQEDISANQAEALVEAMRKRREA